jgi:hypothetical protein
MCAKRTKVTVSLYDEELYLIEQLKRKLEDSDVYLLPSTSEVLRLAVQVLAAAPPKAVAAIAQRLPERRTGRPKQSLKTTYSSKN